jgi:AraC family transcriptional regulator
MAVVGRGRIGVWEGASLWMIEGAQEAADLHLHAHHAIQITFQLAGWFEIGVGGEQLAGPVAAVASDVVHSFRASGTVAFLFIAPESPAGRGLGSVLFADRRSVNVSSGPLLAALATLRASFEKASLDGDMKRLGRSIIAALPVAAAPAKPDARVMAMIDHAQRHLEDRVTLPAAAGHVGLSPERARHLFVAQTGLPFKTYMLWLRIERAVALYAAGSSLTEAAHEAGFADSAHFSRTFRRTFGLPAAALRLSHG